MANVVEDIGHANLKTALPRDTKALAGLATGPGAGALEQVFTSASHAFHDFWRCGTESEFSGQHHAHGFFTAIGHGDAVADAFAVEIHARLRGDGGALEVGGAHGSGLVGAGRCPARLEDGWFITTTKPPVKPAILRQQV